MRTAKVRHRPSRHRDVLDLPPKDSLGHFMSLADFPLNLDGSPDDHTVSGHSHCENRFATQGRRSDACDEGRRPARRTNASKTSRTRSAFHLLVPLATASDAQMTGVTHEWQPQGQPSCDTSAFFRSPYPTLRRAWAGLGHP